MIRNVEKREQHRAHPFAIFINNYRENMSDHFFFWNRPKFGLALMQLRPLEFFSQILIFGLPLLNIPPPEPRSYKWYENWGIKLFIMYTRLWYRCWRCGPVGYACFDINIMIEFYVHFQHKYQLVCMIYLYWILRRMNKIVRC